MKKIYYNPRCSKCRIASTTLDEKNVEYETYEYLSDGITEEDVKEILEKGNFKIDDILRVKEPEYIDHIKGRNLSDEEKIQILIQYPKILQRPIILSNDNAIIARDSETLNKIS